MLGKPTWPVLDLGYAQTSCVAREVECGFVLESFPRVTCVGCFAER